MNRQLCLMLVFAITASRAIASPTAREIMEKVDARDDGDRSVAELEMVLIDRKGKERLRRIKSFSRDVAEDTQRIMFFLHPADVKGTAFLNYDYDDATRDDDQWLYLPALKKTKRIASADKDGSFMGSDFNYSDMTRRDLEDYDYDLLKEIELAGNKLWVIEATPRHKHTIEETGYERSYLFVRQDNYLVVRAIHWLRHGGYKKFLDMKKLERIDGIWVGTEIHMTKKRGKETVHKTILRFKHLRFGQKLEENMFTVRRLEKGL